MTCCVRWTRAGIRNQAHDSADLIAVVTYSYRLQIIQNFTNDRDALDKALKMIQPGETSTLSEMAARVRRDHRIRGPGIGGARCVSRLHADESEFNIFNTDQKLAALESLSRLLRDVPGRKSVLYFSSGVERTGIENQAQLRATVDAANQANVSFTQLMRVPGSTPSGELLRRPARLVRRFTQAARHSPRETRCRVAGRHCEFGWRHRGQSVL